MLREMGAKDASARTARPEQFVDLSFIKELDSSGFISRLYKSTAMAKANTRVESSSAPAAPVKEKTPVLEAKVKPTGTEEKIKTVANQVSSAEEQSSTQVSLARMAITGNQIYVVKGGDTLSRLAKRFYNSVAEWEKIYEANRDILKNPNYIYIGMKLTIPMDDQAG